MFHADLYRLERAETEDLGLQDADVAAGVLAVEWPERLARPITDATSVAIEVAGENERRIAIEVGGSR